MINLHRCPAGKEFNTLRQFNKATFLFLELACPHGCRFSPRYVKTAAYGFFTTIIGLPQFELDAPLALQNLEKFYMSYVREEREYELKDVNRTGQIDRVHYVHVKSFNRRNLFQYAIDFLLVYRPIKIAAKEFNTLVGDLSSGDVTQSTLNKLLSFIELCSVFEDYNSGNY